ncbi:MAG: hypothetical protein M3Q39_02185 [Actinomycetota bacterium]|nr:hypothetical protein [Actinomycetota bacterium]
MKQRSVMLPFDVSLHYHRFERRSPFYRHGYAGVLRWGRTDRISGIEVGLFGHHLLVITPIGRWR